MNNFINLDDYKIHNNLLQNNKIAPKTLSNKVII